MVDGNAGEETVGAQVSGGTRAVDKAGSIVSGGVRV